MLHRYPETTVALPGELMEWAIARGYAVRPLIPSPQEKNGWYIASKKSIL